MTMQPGDDNDMLDRQLMLRLRDFRDETALRCLMERYKAPVYAMAYRMLGNTADAEELTQLTFIRVWKAAPDYQPSARFTTWLFTIVRHLVFNESRRKKRKPTDSLSAWEEEGHHPGTEATSSPDAHLQQKELEQVVNRALRQLAPKARMAVQLRRFQEMSYEEIAEVLNLSLSATKSLLFRARQELREALSAYL